VGSHPTEALLKRSDLRTVRYRNVLAQIELRFDGFPHVVMLYNVEMDINRRSQKAALLMIQKNSNAPIERSFLWIFRNVGSSRSGFSRTTS
jgi:hypothetical protein